ncbi:MAG: glycosyltransferase family 4 protein [Candidatus Limnocylindria bacterium]
MRTSLGIDGPTDVGARSLGRPRIVAFAFSCEPGAGSEPGTGWLWARMLAGIGETWVIVRRFPARVDAIARALERIPERASLHFIHLDDPPLAERRSWATHPLWGRVEYLLWQRSALRLARDLHQQIRFDLAWHLTYANAWFGSLAAQIGPPFVYGPVGGGLGPPWRLVPALGASGTMHEVARTGGRLLGRHANPVARIAWERARLILVQNPETREWLPEPHRSKAIVFPNVVMDEPRLPARPPRDPASPPTAFFAGRLLAWKGVALALHAMRLLPEWRLVICGDGAEESRLRRLCGALGLDHRVTFRGWLSRDRLREAMREEGDVFLFPSLHDEGCWAVGEAISWGLPAVCLDRGGPPILATRTVPATGLADTVAGLARALEAVRGAVPAVPALDMASRRADLAAALAEARLI